MLNSADHASTFLPREKIFGENSLNYTFVGTDNNLSVEKNKEKVNTSINDYKYSHDKERRGEIKIKVSKKKSSASN